MTAKIFRYNPAVDTQPYFVEYKIDLKPNEHMTVMSMLEYIAENMDGTLSFFSHSA